MRRISLRHARQGMVLGRAVYDSQGHMILDSGSTLSEDCRTTLAIYEVGEVLIEDRRVSDVPVQSVFAPELEAQVAQAIRQLITESRGNSRVDDILVEDVEKSIYGMARAVFPEGIGEVNVAGCISLEDYDYVQPVKVAALSLLMCKMAGYGLFSLANLGIAALLKNVGYILLQQDLAESLEPQSESEPLEYQKHPGYGAKFLGEYERFNGPEVVEAVLQHHERWDGSGYPEGLKGTDISPFARILAITDTYFELVSVSPDEAAYLPHEAVEYILAYSGELFDPELVQLFTRLVPLYPTGTTVKLNAGELGIVSNANLGHIGRPIVRICTDENAQPLNEPYDIDLAQPKHQHLLVVEVDPYLAPWED